MDDERYKRTMREPDAEQDAGQVTFWLGRAQAKTADLEKVVAALAKKLEPIRSTAPSPEMKGNVFSENGPGSPLAQELSTIESRVADAVDSLAMLLHEIDL